MSEILDRQIKCVERELAMRRNVYSTRVQAGKMPQHVMDEEIETMAGVLRTLQFMKKWESVIRSSVELAKEQLAPFTGAGLDVDESGTEIKRLI